MAKSAKHQSKDQTRPALQLSGTSPFNPCFSTTFLFRQEDCQPFRTGAWCLCSPQQADLQAQLSTWSPMNSSSTENKWRVPSFCYTVYLIDYRCPDASTFSTDHFSTHLKWQQGTFKRYKQIQYCSKDFWRGSKNLKLSRCKIMSC